MPVAGERLLIWVEEDQPLIAVDDDRLAARDVGQLIPHADHGRNA
jgi:hypothetical protein